MKKVWECRIPAPLHLWMKVWEVKATNMNHGRRNGEPCPSLDFEISSRKSLFS